MTLFTDDRKRKENNARTIDSDGRDGKKDYLNTRYTVETCYAIPALNTNTLTYSLTDRFIAVKQRSS